VPDTGRSLKDLPWQVADQTGDAPEARGMAAGFAVR
jgi:hypothetical protein